MKPMRVQPVRGRRRSALRVEVLTILLVLGVLVLLAGAAAWLVEILSRGAQVAGAG